MAPVAPPVARPRVLRILERLARQPSVPFHEHGVSREAAAIAREGGAAVRRDQYGNLIVRRPGRRRGPPLWLVAHMDHPGFEAVRRDEAVFLGGVDPAYFRRGTKLRFYTRDGEVPAKIERARTAKGSTRVRLAASQPLHPKDLGVWDVPDFRMTGGRVHARQLDDLVGCAISLACVERAARRGANVQALLTRAEEVGLVGTTGAILAGRVPKSAWVVNVEASRVVPGVTVGGGPVIRVGDRAKTFDLRAENLLLAAQAHLPRTPVQRALMTGGVCEATAWTLFGYRATGVAIPLENYHNMGSGNRVRTESVSVRDLTGAVDLVDQAARHVPEGARWDARGRDRVLDLWRRHRERLQMTTDL